MTTKRPGTAQFGLAPKVFDGLRTHLRVFVSVVAILFVANAVTRGEDGSWWIVDVLSVWAVVWSLHVWGAVSAKDQDR